MHTSTVLLLAFVRPAAAASVACLSLSIDARVALHATAPYFASVNIDSSTDREFFTTPFDSPALLAAAAGLAAGGAAPGHVRFGGTGNNALVYDVPGAPPCVPTSSRHTCLNESTGRGVAGLAAAAASPIIFGANFFPSGSSANKTFDPTNAVAFFTWVRGSGLAPIWGVECGKCVHAVAPPPRRAQAPPLTPQ